MWAPELYDGEENPAEWDEYGNKIVRFYLVGRGKHIRTHVSPLLWGNPKTRKLVLEEMRCVARQAYKAYGIR